jgi:hypothetical protein
MFRSTKAAILLAFELQQWRASDGGPYPSHRAKNLYTLPPGDPPTPKAYQEV